MSETYRPVNQETDDAYNAKGGIVKIPGSKLAKEHMKFEQFPSDWGANPGNPYQFREFPMMVYRAQKVNGVPMVTLPDPRRYDFPTRDEYKNAFDRQANFGRENQKIVKSPEELSRAMEEGWRPTPGEAIQLVHDRDGEVSRATAEREYHDRNLSEVAQREIRAAKNAVGNEHLPEIPEKPVRRRGRPKGSKNKPKG